MNVLQQDVAKSIAVKAVLDHVGLGIAMGNGSAALQAVANFVTKRSTDGGIDFALRQFQMI